MSENRLALATYEDKPNLTEGDQLLRKNLEDRSMATEVVDWEDETVNWNDYDSVLVRSVWNYYRKYEKFLDWIDTVESSSADLWNPADVLRWNSNKWYLRDLREAGVPVIPTTFVPKGASISLSRILEEKGWSRAVVKPMVGAGSHRLFETKVSGDQEKEGLFNSLVEDTGALVQPFQESVKDGEYSFFFFLQDYSYCVRKRPTEDSFQAHQDFDADFEVIQPEQTLIDRASTLIRKINKPWVYVRLDCIVNGDELLVMEAEMTEPNFYFEHYREGAEIFAEAIGDVLTGEETPDQGGLGFTMGH